LDKKRGVPIARPREKVWECEDKKNQKKHSQVQVQYPSATA
jgi:hypothetical protein